MTAKAAASFCGLKRAIAVFTVLTQTSRAHPCKKALLVVLEILIAASPGARGGRG